MENGTVHRNSSYPIQPAHPLIADFLCETATRFADTFEPAWLALGVFVRRVFWTLFVVVPFALIVGRALDVLP